MGGGGGGVWRLVSNWAASLLSEKTPHGEDIIFDGGAGGSKKNHKMVGHPLSPLPSPPEH